MGIFKYFKEIKDSINDIKKIKEKQFKSAPITITGRVDGLQGIGTFYGKTNGVSCKIIKSYNSDSNKDRGSAKLHFIFDLDTHKFIEIPLANIYDDESLKTYGRSFPVRVIHDEEARETVVELEKLPGLIYEEQKYQNLIGLDIIVTEEGILKITMYDKKDLYGKSYIGGDYAI